VILLGRLLKSSKLSLDDILNRLRSGEKIGFHEQKRIINFQELRNTINEEEYRAKKIKNEEERRKKQEEIKEVRRYLVNQYREVKEGIQIFDEKKNPIKNKIKTMTIFSGPSGSGKSTITQLLKNQIGKIIDVDELSRLDGLGFHESRERATELIDQYIDKGMSFSIENTLRNDGIFKNIEKARESGYQIIVYYVGLMDVDLNLERIKERVLHEGNEVPTDVVLNIYKESLSRMKQLVEIADQAVIIDNSGTQPVAVAQFEDGEMIDEIDNIYVEWVKESLNWS
jgi:predicted ABC-type ATPase